MKTKGDCMALYLSYLDEATKKGVDLPATKNADYRAKFNQFIDEAQKYIAGIVKIPAVMQITQNLIPNQLGVNAGYDLKQYLPGTPVVFTQKGTKSLYFEMDNVGTATIAVNGVTVETINNTAKRQFTAYRVLTGANSTDTVTLTFSGNYIFNYRNVALYAYAFPTEEDIQEWAPYVAYPMPSDFMSFDMPIRKTDPRVYENYIAHKWEKNKRIVFNSADKGSFDIHYFKYPATILPTAADNTPLEVEDKAVDLVVLQAGIMATAADNPALSSWLRSLYIEKVQNIVGSELPGDTSIQTVYSM